jgi:hypothetical protein
MVALNSNNDKKTWSGIAGAGIAGFLELSLFHPFDTAAKRLMNHRLSYKDWKVAKKVVFGGDKMTLRSLYPAFNFAVVYKILQR